MSEYIIDATDWELNDGEILTHFGRKSREQLIRCRDCKKWTTEKRFTFKCIGPEGIFDPDGFCSRGIKKEAGE